MMNSNIYTSKLYNSQRVERERDREKKKDRERVRERSGRRRV